MSDPQFLTIERQPGLPPHATPGVFYGFDKIGTPYLLTWADEVRCFFAIGFDPNSSHPVPVISHLLREENAELIVAWSRTAWERQAGTDGQEVAR